MCIYIREFPVNILASEQEWQAGRGCGRGGGGGGCWVAVGWMVGGGGGGIDLWLGRESL